MDRIYFDYKATARLAHESAPRAQQPFVEGEFGNASSSPWAGQRMVECSGYNDVRLNADELPGGLALANRFTSNFR